MYNLPPSLLCTPFARSPSRNCMLAFTRFYQRRLSRLCRYVSMWTVTLAFIDILRYDMRASTSATLRRSTRCSTSLSTSVQRPRLPRLSHALIVAARPRRLPAQRRPRDTPVWKPSPLRTWSSGHSTRTSPLQGMSHEHRARDTDARLVLT